MRLDQPYGKRFEDILGNVEPKHTYFIACEGKKTEYRYFEGLLKAREELGIKSLIEVLPIRHGPGTNSHPLTIITEAKAAMDRCDVYFPEFDTVCIIVDRDAKSFTDTQYLQAEALCKQNDFRFIVSNPCIEIWFLFHYTNLKGYSLEELVENRKVGERTSTEIVLKDDFLQGSYHIARIQFERNFKPYVHMAIENSKLYATSTEALRMKLGTNLGLLIEEILE